ncbi:hypothetical protein BEK98_44590 [Streptomyces diastatochromogenes]|uniref:Transmembrane protein n=2 Tax=Streptomyces diastatochromogenes TaxID=42236 RepID=A0A233RT34_STRDA|nr:hypothetical protein BEK98_44590 [Streptomyces diastatochromogenes]
MDHANEMTAADSAGESATMPSDTGETRDDSADGHAALRVRARRISWWSAIWYVLAAAMWALLYFLLAADYGPEVTTDRGSESLCQAPLLNPWPDNHICQTDHLHQWPTLLGILALAVIPSVAAAATTVYAKLLHHLAHRTLRTPA